MRTLLLVGLLLLGGCSHGLYDWGGYNQRLYNYYENPQAINDFILALERYLQQMESAGKKPAPGLYAELGTLYLQMGDTPGAIELYKKERDVWPESQHLMTALITNLEKDSSRQQPNSLPE